MARRGTAGSSEPQESPGNNMSQQPSAMGADRGNGRTGGDGHADGGVSMRNPHEQHTFSPEEIAERAYQIYERDGRSDGRDMDHWLQAERELREERTREESRNLSPQSNASANRSQRPDEAPRSARRHQAAMNQ